MKVWDSINKAIILSSMSGILLLLNTLSGNSYGGEFDSPDGQIQSRKLDWLEGTGKDLRIKITGKVIDENGSSADGFELDAHLETSFGSRDLPLTIAGNQFEFWVPVGNAGWWFSIQVNATSSDGQRIVREKIFSNQIRQFATEGLDLKLKKPERSVEVAVVEDGRAVPNAFVAAEFEGLHIQGKTNDAGVVVFPVMKRDNLSQLTAWTEDFKIGGYSFSRKPTRDPKAGKFTIELEKCRPQTIRIVNEENNAPIPNLDFILTVGTGKPDFQYPGKTPDCEMKTDKNGEAVFRRFPDWKQHHSYIQVPDPHWVKVKTGEIVDGKMVFKLRKSRFDQRQHVVGAVKSADGNVAGFCVEIDSSQGEEKNTSDMLTAFTDERGQFAADYLPELRYCLYVGDTRLVSDIIDLIPYEQTPKKITCPSLNIRKGQPIEIVATVGPDRKPIANQYINLSTPHEYPFREEGMSIIGIGGRRWGVTTDEQGKATTIALPGKLEGNIFTPEWRMQESVEVKPEGVTRLEFHLKISAKRKIAGRFLPASNIETDLKDAQVEIGSIDGETDERMSLKASSEGKFEFESQASRIGIYARTKDEKAAAVAVIDHMDEPVELQLKLTGEYRGQLLGEENRPLKGHAVHASLNVGTHQFSKNNPTSFHAAAFESKTDAEGNYVLSGLPQEVKLNLLAAPLDGSDHENYLDDFYLVPEEVRPLAVSRLWNPVTKISFAERYAKALRDCRLSHFYAMVILFRPSEEVKKFVDANLMDYEKTQEVSSFIQLQGQLGDEPADVEVVEFAKAKGWPTLEKGKIFACAIDPAGKELGRIELDAKSAEASASAARFIREQAPPVEDAKKKWDEAFAKAKQTNRKVWVRISQRYCGPCFRLARWLDDHKEVLDRDYVMLKIDDCRDSNGFEVAQRLTGGESYGVPFFAIFDAGERKLITSDSPLGNIGHPSGFEGKKHLRKMLMETRDKLTDKQIEELMASLED